MDARCPACEGELADLPAIRGSDRLHGLPGSFEVRTCPACGSGRTYPLVAPEDLGTLYPSAYNAYRLPAGGAARLAATALFQWRYRSALGRPPLSALRDRGPGRLLDVGGGRGDLGVVLTPRGWQVVCLDPSQDACDEAAERGVTSIRGTLTGGQDGDLAGPFDAIVFQHSLEHVTEPLADLAAARDLLRPGGLVLVSLPNFSSWQRRRFGANWFHLDLPRHRSHFSEHGIALALERAGLSVSDVATSTSADGLPTSLQFRRYRGRRFEAGLGLYLAFAATLAAVPLTSLANRVGGDGDILHAVARVPDGRRLPFRESPSGTTCRASNLAATGSQRRAHRNFRPPTALQARWTPPPDTSP